MKKDKKLPSVSCLLLNWNGIAFTKKCLRSLLKTEYKNFDIVVVDNGSENNEADALEREFGNKIKLIRSKINLGYAAGMNLAIKNSTGEYVMVLNNDMEFDRKWLHPLVEILEKNESVGACQPKIKDLKAKKNFEYAAAAGGYIDVLGYPFARGRVFSAVEPDRGQYNQAAKISWAGVILIKRIALKKAGLFDPIFFNYAEDVDLCYRLYGQGYNIVYTPKSVVYHYGGGAMGTNSVQKMFFIHRNHLILIIKNWDLRTLLLILLPRILLDVVSFFYYFATGYKHISFALIRAYFSLFNLMPRVIKSRKTAQKIIKKENRSLMPMYQGSIVWEYFIRRKKTFLKIMNDKNYILISE